jgi:hypothetical protein
MLINFCDTFCHIKVAELKESFKYASLFFAASKLQTNVPYFNTDEDSVLTREEFFSFQIYY